MRVIHDKKKVVKLLSIGFKVSHEVEVCCKLLTTSRVEQILAHFHFAKVELEAVTVCSADADFSYFKFVITWEVFRWTNCNYVQCTDINTLKKLLDGLLHITDCPVRDVADARC